MVDWSAIGPIHDSALARECPRQTTPYDRHHAPERTLCTRVIPPEVPEQYAGALLAEHRLVASGRTMAAIDLGRGRKPKPFMLAKAFDANAVWQS